MRKVDLLRGNLIPTGSRSRSPATTAERPPRSPTSCCSHGARRGGRDAPGRRRARLARIPGGGHRHPVTWPSPWRPSISWGSRSPVTLFALISRSASWSTTRSSTSRTSCATSGAGEPWATAEGRHGRGGQRGSQPVDPRHAHRDRGRSADAFVQGLMGPYMRPIPIGATAAMLFSMAVAFVVTPWAAYYMLAGTPSTASRPSRRRTGRPAPTVG